MKVGVGMFVTGYTVDAVTFARAAEDHGFESIWVPDHPVLPVNPETPYRRPGQAIPQLYGEMADPFVLLSFIAAVTSKVRLGTGVTLLPERHPLTLANTIGTLDNFSNGRVTLGVGAGWLREEIELYGTDFNDRWGYTNESILAMKALWEHGIASFEGKRVRFGEVRCDPLPKQRPHPPGADRRPGLGAHVPAHCARRRRLAAGHGVLRGGRERPARDRALVRRSGARRLEDGGHRLRDGRDARDAAQLRVGGRGPARRRGVQPPGHAAAVRALGRGPSGRPHGRSAAGGGDNARAREHRGACAVVAPECAEEGGDTRGVSSSDMRSRTT